MPGGRTSSPAAAVDSRNGAGAEDARRGAPQGARRGRTSRPCARVAPIWPDTCATSKPSVSPRWSRLNRIHFGDTEAEHAAMRSGKLPYSMGPTPLSARTGPMAAAAPRHLAHRVAELVDSPLPASSRPLYDDDLTLWDKGAQNHSHPYLRAPTTSLQTRRFGTEFRASTSVTPAMVAFPCAWPRLSTAFPPIPSS